MNGFNLGSMSIFSLGNVLSETLAEYGVTKESELVIYTDGEQFRMVDEDLFYRNRKDENENFVPSENEIEIKFEKVRIIIKKKE